MYQSRWCRDLDGEGDSAPEIVAGGGQHEILFVLDVNGNEKWIDTLKPVFHQNNWITPTLVDINEDGVNDAKLYKCPNNKIIS